MRSMAESVSSELTNLHPALRRCWHPVARSSEVGQEPLRAVLLNQAYVLWRDPEGVLHGLIDECPHRRAPLSLGCVNGGLLQCGYHGWKFDGEGVCQEIPALGPDSAIPSRAHARAPFGVEESHGMVFLAPEEPVNQVPMIPEADDASFMWGDLPAVTTRGSAALLADNFLDVAHFPFVHAGTFGAEEVHLVEPYEVVREGLGHYVEVTHDFANREDPGVGEGIRPLIQKRRLTYRYTAPFHLSLRIEFLDAGGVNTIGFFLCPEDAETTRVYSTLWRNDLDGDQARLDEAVAFEVAVIEEDLIIQSRYGVLSVSTDPTKEIHTRADKSSLEMRRILADVIAMTTP